MERDMVLISIIFSLLDTCEMTLAELIQRCADPAHIEQLLLIQQEREVWKQALR